MAEVTLDPPTRVCTALDWDADDPTVSIDALNTLPHSFVARVRRGSGASMIFKQAGSPAFAPGVRKELIVNRDVLRQLPVRVGPALVHSDEHDEIPWMLFEDVAATHGPPPNQPPAHRHIEAFVRALAHTHAHAREFDLDALFANVPGDRYITDGSEHVSAVLDGFLNTIERDRFPAPTFLLIEAIRDNIDRVAREQSFDATIVHGDAHFANAFYASGEREVDAVLLDWALAVIGPGEADLAHALGMNLPRFMSRAYEQDLLDVYAETQIRDGFAIERGDVYERFRRALLITVIVAIGMKSVPGMLDQVWSYLFINAVETALEHDVGALIG